MRRVHGTCVKIGGAGVLFRGESGSGKSDLALRLIDQGALLVSDDQVELALSGQSVVARAPEPIAGLIEVRGVGLFHLPYRDAPLKLIIDLVAGRPLERLPEVSYETVLDASIPRFDLNPWEISATAKVRIALRAVSGEVSFLG